MNGKIVQMIFVILGFLFVGIGALGVILPVLPTTPFLLAASYFFARGSSRFHQWFTSTKLYKKHLESFVASRSMTLRTKWSILLPASGMLLIAFIICPVIYGRIFILLIAIYKYYYFFTKINTKPDGK